jgi:hypothetical protein
MNQLNGLRGRDTDNDHPAVAVKITRPRAGQGLYFSHKLYLLQLYLLRHFSVGVTLAHKTDNPEGLNEH